jgi:SAM-dependent methyltransferase
MRGARRAVFEALRSTGLALSRASRAFHQLAAGLMRVEDMRDEAVRAWEGYGLSNSEGFVLHPWEEAFYAKHILPRDRILLVGCGCGRDLVALAERGHRVVGVEPVPSAAARAREEIAKRGLACEVVTAFIEDVPDAPAVDAVIFTWSAFPAIPHADLRVRMLRALTDPRRNTRGLVLLWVPHWSAPRRAMIALTKVAARVSRSDYRPEYGDHVPDGVFARFEHRFPPGALEEEVARAGMVVIDRESIDAGVLVAIKRA